jgi:3'-phosphoadenosine 5'-phosphosulfate sulfotransferase (PAPS reductase)/FAD synthetase
MKHIVSLSGGTASAVVGDLVIKKYGRDNITLYFMDTNWEDKDLYRFLNDLESYWEKDIVKLKDGRTPLQVGEDVKFILNSRVRQCSFQLKIKPFTDMIKKHSKPVTIHLGLDWSEEHRMEAPKKNYEAIEGVSVDYPLTWKPIPTKKYSEIVESWGIEIPRLYKMGFPHNNCGGRCVAQGKGEWRRLKRMFPERFEEVAEWEDKMRKELPKAKDKSILKDVTLKELARVGQDQMDMFEGVAEDSFSCFCAY